MNTTANVPFYPNMDDDLHCTQASFRMILKYFLPDRTFSWKEMDEMSAHSTWPSQMMLSLVSMGFTVAIIEGFDAKAFIADGGEYLRREFGPETSEWQLAHSNIPKEQKLYQQVLDSGVEYHHRIPTIDDIRDYIQRGYLVKVTLNSRRLNHKDGYVGHAVVVYAVDEQQVTFHDPGLPAREARTESITDFQAAWADPNDNAKELIAVTYKEAS